MYSAPGEKKSPARQITIVETKIRLIQSGYPKNFHSGNWINATQQMAARIDILIVCRNIPGPKKNLSMLIGFILFPRNVFRFLISLLVRSINALYFPDVCKS